MRDNDLSAAELAEALSRGAAGMDTCEAAIRLLVAHGVWPVRLAAARFVELSDEDETEEPRYAWVGWRYAVAALDAETLTGGSGSDNRVLRIAGQPLRTRRPRRPRRRGHGPGPPTNLPWCWPPCRTPTAPMSTRATPPSGPRTAAHLSLPLTPPCSRWGRSSGGRNAERGCSGD